MAVTAAVGVTRTRRWPGRLAWALWALAILELAVAVWVDQLLRQASRPDLVFLTPTAFPPVLGAVSTAAVGAVLASRHPVGWLLLVLGLSLAWGGVAPGLCRLRAAGPPRRPPSRQRRSLVLAHHRRHRPDRTPLCPAAHPHRVAALAPLARVARMTVAAAAILVVGLGVARGPLDPRYQVLGGPFDFRGRPEQAWMLNFRVRDLDGMLAQLRAAGVAVDSQETEEGAGRFAWLVDPEGNRIEL